MPDDTPPFYIADTHALVWHLIGDKKLSLAARGIFTKIEAGEAVLVIPAVVLAELFMIAEKGRTTLLLSTLTRLVQDWRTADNIRLTGLTADLVIASTRITTIPDIFDRMIVAEAGELGIPIITRDPIITTSKLVPVIW